MRNLAAHESEDELNDFLTQPRFYDALHVSRVTRLAALHLKEATAIMVGALEDGVS